jgi:hypothetical protein
VQACFLSGLGLLLAFRQGADISVRDRQIRSKYLGNRVGADGIRLAPALPADARKTTFLLARA